MTAKKYLRTKHPRLHKLLEMATLRTMVTDTMTEFAEYKKDNKPIKVVINGKEYFKYIEYDVTDKEINDFYDKTGF